MTWIDWPLAITGMLFLILGFLYGWGLLRFFKHNFRWHRASITGILSVISCLAAFVWLPRYGSTIAREIYFSLFVVFSLALPGMIYVDLELQKDKQKCQQERDDEILRLRRVVAYQNEKLRSIQNTIEVEGKGALPRVESILEMSTDGSVCNIGILN